MKEDDKKKESVRDKSYFIEIGKTILWVLLAFLFIRYFIFQPFLVVGDSMEPTFHEGEYIIVNEASYSLFSPKRGDVVVFKHPSDECIEFVESNLINRKFRQGPCRNFIKRLVGLPGETVEIKDGQISIYNDKKPNGFILEESQYTNNIKLFGNQKVDLGAREYYVIGDNREPNGSSDSREWGALERKFITGKASIVIFPFNEAGLLSRPQY